MMHDDDYMDIEKGEDEYSSLAGPVVSLGAKTPGKPHRRPLTPRLWSSHSNDKSAFNINDLKSPPVAALP